MRSKTIVGLLILGMAVIIAFPAVTIGQFQPGGRKGGGFGGFGGFGGGMIAQTQNPDQLFESLAKGRNFFLISETRTLNAPLSQFAQERGITNGQITKQQFSDFMTQMRAKAGTPGQSPAPGGQGSQGGRGPSGGFGTPGGGFGQGGGFGMQGGGLKKFSGGDSPSARPGLAPTNPDALKEMSDGEFKRRDRNDDGKLNRDEMPSSLRDGLTRWDKNGDSFIDIEEYRDYFMARLQGEEINRGIASIIIEENELDLKPIVYRAGNLPKNLPSWFKDLDTDGDGQVALFEWRAGKKYLEEFGNWDMNDDGFITVEEALRQQNILASNSTKGDPASTGAFASGNNGGGKKFGGGGEGGGRPPWGAGGNTGEGGRPQWGAGGNTGEGGRPAFGGFQGFGKGKKGGGR